MSVYKCSRATVDCRFAAVKYARKMPVKAPEISIITVVFNAANYIESCIKSVIDQSYTNFEFIVVDGGSVDGTLEIVDLYRERIDVLVSEKDRGIYDAMNKGVGLASGNWLYFLGADDRLANKDVLSEIAKIDKDGLDVIYGNIMYDNGVKFRSSFDWKMLLRNTLHHQSAFYCSKIFSKNSFDINNKILSDYEINLVLYLQGARTVYVNMDIATCSHQGVSKNVKFSLYKEEMKIRKRHLSKCLAALLDIWSITKYVIKKLRSI